MRHEKSPLRLALTLVCLMALAPAASAAGKSANMPTVNPYLHNSLNPISHENPAQTDAVDVASGKIPLYVEVLCEKREKLIEYLAEQDIQTRPFYPCLHTAAHLGISGRFKNSTVFGGQGLVLPCGPEQPFENIDRVIKMIHCFGERDQ